MPAPNPVIWITVHPRVCGEHATGMESAAVVAGSSPRVRGTRPASAWAWWTSSVHPRVCGEHAGGAGAGERAVGSSPRVRGTLVLPILGVFLVRFIPACAGNTSCKSLPLGLSSVHPRVCGEHFSDMALWRMASGSSPRVRGTRPDARGAPRRRRFIPACAGNTGR